MDELGRIRTFIKVVEAGSFSAAARDTSSTSSVARQVKSLEDELGVRLLNRSTRSLSLTEPGRLFYNRARTLTNDLGNAMSEARSFHDDVKGVLRVSLRVTVGTTVIVPALPSFLAKYPEICLDISLSDEKCDLIANEIDVAVWMGELPNTDIVARRLSPSRRIVCGSPAYFAKHGVPQYPDDLRQHNCLHYTGRAFGNTWQFSKANEQQQIEIRGSLRTDNGLVLLSAALANIGLIVVHEWMVSGLISQGKLTRVLKDYTVNPTPGDAEIFVVYPNSRGLSRKIRAFVDFLISLFPDSYTSLLHQNDSIKSGEAKRLY